MKFSIIVPCYNCNETIDRLLQSIVDQEESDLEVILVDDTDDKGFYDLVDRFHKDLSIKIIETEHKYHNPGNSRNYGIEAAKGDWILFIDSDDDLRPEALKWFSNAIDSGDYTFIFGLMKLFHPDGSEYTAEEDFQAKHLVWLHGKCYNRNFILEHNIRFKKDMRTCEDYYFNYQVLAHTLNEELLFCNLDVFVYNWRWNKNSLSRSNSYVLNIREHFYDHIEASLLPWVNIEVNKNPLPVFKYYLLNIRIAYYLYQYYLRKGIYFEKSLIRQSLSKIYQVFGITVLDLINVFEDNYEDSMAAYSKTVGIVHENFICPESFRTWIMNMSIC